MYMPVSLGNTFQKSLIREVDGVLSERHGADRYTLVSTLPRRGRH